MILFLFLLPQLIFSQIIQDQVLTTEKNAFDFKTVCQKMVTHETPLIEITSNTELDCMGKKISVLDFCDKEMIQDPYYLRGYINKDKKQVICHSGKKVNFKYRCSSPSKNLCGEKAEVSCLEIKEKLAKRLDLTHSSVSTNEQGQKVLNCMFESLPLKK